MRREKIEICLLRVGGTNRDLDAAHCFESLGVQAQVVHLNELLENRDLSQFHGLVFPGGFAYGDYVRAGAILGKKILSHLKEEVSQFSSERKPILGVCNGFQVLVEAGLLPGYDFLSETPEVALAPNKSGRFECRWVTLRPNSNSPCIFTHELEGPLRFPIAHGEGRFIASNASLLKKLKDRNQIALQYTGADGALADGHYPHNPNGSALDIAGICDPSGTVFGLMPHPENAFRGRQMPDWITNQERERGDGYALLESMIKYIERTF